MVVFLKEGNIDIRYHLDKEEFDGPLDLLLTMVKEQKIEIKEIFISDITTQYLKYVSEMPINSDYTADFIYYAAELLEAKSEALLPKIIFEDVNGEEELPADQLLFYRLERYKLFAEAANKLKDLETLNRFYKKPDFKEEDYRVVIKNFNLDKLIRAFTMLLERIEREEDKNEEKTIMKELVTVAERVKQLADLLKERFELRFFNMFEKDTEKVVVINTFLAILELLRKQIAVAETEEETNDIILRLHPDGVKNIEEVMLNDVEEYT